MHDQKEPYSGLLMRGQVGKASAGGLESGLVWCCVLVLLH